MVINEFGKLHKKEGGSTFYPFMYFFIVHIGFLTFFLFYLSVPSLCFGEFYNQTELKKKPCINISYTFLLEKQLA